MQGLTGKDDLLVLAAGAASAALRLLDGRVAATACESVIAITIIVGQFF